jgi:hypothetical protein
LISALAEKLRRARSGYKLLVIATCVTSVGCASTSSGARKTASNSKPGIGCLDTLQAADSIMTVIKLSVAPQDTTEKLQTDFEAFFAQEFRRRFRAPRNLPLSVVMGAPPCDSAGARCVGGYLDLNAVAYLTAHYDGKLSDIQVVDATLTPDLADSVRSALETMSHEGLGPTMDADTMALIVRLEADPNPDTVPEIRHVFLAKVPHYNLPFRYASMPASGAEPRYPFAARLAGVGDSVAIAFTVDAKGRIAPESLELMRASYGDFVASVVNALQRTRYHPARLGDCPVSTRMSQRFLFDVPKE